MKFLLVFLISFAAGANPLKTAFDYYTNPSYRHSLDRASMKSPKSDAKIVRRNGAIVLVFSDTSERLDGFGESYIRKSFLDSYQKVHYMKGISATRAKFYRSLKDLLANKSIKNIDLFLMTHGGASGFSTSDHYVEKNEIEELSSLAGFRKKIRLVFQINCDGAELNETWMRVGAKTVIGSPGIQFLVPLYYKSIRDWARSKIALREAIDRNFLFVRNTGSYIVEGAELSLEEMFTLGFAPKDGILNRQLPDSRLEASSLSDSIVRAVPVINGNGNLRIED